MQPPNDVTLPFISYGMFKPGELGFLRIKPFVKSIEPLLVPKQLRVRDGLPILDWDRPGKTVAAAIEFIYKDSLAAYQAICNLEPEDQYRWEIFEQDGLAGNILVGKNAQRGSVPVDSGHEDWQGKKDPLFTAALSVIEEALENNERFEWDLKPMMRLQMAYLLLWSSIERYATIRYCLANKPTAKVRSVGEEYAFATALKEVVSETRSVFSAVDPSDKYTLNPENPRGSIYYYYQLRSNAIHAGKGAPRDHEVIAKSLSELLQIFKVVLISAFAESSWPEPDDHKSHRIELYGKSP